MAETHELRLKINAAAARAGAREFVGAINSIKTAVRALDRDSDGVFKRLKKNLQGATRGSKVKLNIVDRNSLKNLDSYSRLAANAVRATANTSRSVSNLTQRMTALSGAYAMARTQADAYTASVNRLNTALGRQSAVAAKAAGAITAPRATTTTAPTTGGGSGAASASRGAAQAQVADQERVQRAIETTRLSVERLTTQLMKVGGFQAMSELGRQFRDFQRSVSSGTRSTEDFARAQGQMRSAITGATTSLVTMTAKARDQVRAEGEAAKAARNRERATLAASNAMRVAEMETARLTQRLRAVGDTKGIEQLNSAMTRLRGGMSSVGASTQQVRANMAAFQNTANGLKVSLIAVEGAATKKARSAREAAKASNDASVAARRLERDMRSAAGAAHASSRAFREATGSARGLENAFNGSFQAASLFRTALGSITLGTFTKSVFQAGDALQQFNITMEVASGSAEAAAQDLEFINSIASKLGTNLNASRDAFAKFAVSSDIAGVSGETTKEIFESVSTAMAVLGRGTEDQRLAFLALEQMMSKGVISAEELRRQLGERLPGAVNLMARAVGVSTSELQDMLKAGELISSEVLPKFAKELNKTFGSQLSRTFNRAGSNLGRLQTEFTKVLEVIANSGFLDELSEQFRDLTSLMRSSDVRAAAARIGEGLADAARIGGDAIQWLIENIETVGVVVRNVIGGVVVAQFAKMGQAAMMGAQQTLVAVRAYQSLGGSATVAAGAITKQGAAAATAAGQTTKLATATTSAAVAGGKLGAAFGAFGRIFGLLGGPVGIAISALTLVPLLLNTIGEDSEAVSSEYEAAMRRMGASTFFFIDQAKELENIDPFAQLNANLPLLREAQEEIAKFRVNSDLDVTINEQFEAIKAAAPAASEAVDKLAQDLEKLRTTTDNSENLKQIDALKRKIIELIGTTGKVPGAFEAIRDLEKSILPGTRAIQTASGIMNENVEIAGKDAREIEKLGDAWAGLNDDISQNADSIGTTLVDLSNRISGFAGMTNSAEMRSFVPQLQAIGNTFDGTSESVEAARAKLDQIKEAMARVAESNPMPPRLLQQFEDAVAAAEDEIAALETLQGEADSTKAALDALSGAVSANAGAMGNATNAAYGYAGALREIQGLQAEAQGFAQEAGVKHAQDIEVATLRANGNLKEAAILQDRYTGATSRTVAEMRKTAKAAQSAADAEVARLKAAGAKPEAIDSARADTAKAVAAIEGDIAAAMEAGAAATGKIFDLRAQSKKGGGGGGGSAKEEADALQELMKSMNDFNDSAQEDILAMKLMADGRVATAEAAGFMAEAMRLGVNVTDAQTASFFEQIDAVEKLKESMERLANDPVNDWMDSVPMWREAGQQIEVGVMDSLSDSISQFIQTGKMDFESLGESILGVVSDIIADKAVKELTTLLGGNTSGEGEGGFGLGGLMSDLFGNGGSMGDEADPFAAGGGVDTMAIQNALVTGGQQAAEFIRQAMTTGGTTAQSQISAGGAQAGQQVAQGVTQGATQAQPQLSGSLVTGAQGAAPILSSSVSTGVTSGSLTGGDLLGAGVEAGSKQGGGIFQQIFGSMMGGGGGGGGFAGILTSILPAIFGDGGGVTTGGPAMPTVMAPAGMFRNAPSFAAGTTNTTGGIPAILHDNEAVVPLSGGRKIPIEGEMGGDGSKTVVQNFNITTPDADSFRKSQTQIAADAAGAGQRALQRNR